jgi:hypothetical protein
MSSATLFRLSGLALLVALPLQIVGFVLHPPSEQVADVLLIVGAIVTFAPIPLAGAVLSVAVAWMGFLLFRGRVVSIKEPARVD